MARPQVLEELKSLGWTGPTSYTLPYLNELIERLKAGETPEQIEASRRKTSVKVNGGGRQPKGEWVACDNPGVEATEPCEVEVNGIKYRWMQSIVQPDGTTVPQCERFVPTVKVPKGPKDKGTWEQCEMPDTPTGWTPVDGELELGDVKYRRSTVAVEDENGAPVGVSHIWERYVPYVKPVKEKATGKRATLAGQTADFDPRSMMRVFENQDMRIRTGGRDWTLLDVDWLQEQLDAARGRGDAAVSVTVDGSAEACDVVWLEALVSVKRRLALREEVNGDGTIDGAGEAAGQTDEGNVRVEDESTQTTGEA